MRLFFVGCLGLVLGISQEDKENSCFLLVNYFINERKSEIKNFCEENLQVRELGLRGKLEEDGFRNCVGNIRDSQVERLKKEKGGNFGKYEELVKVDLRRYVEGGVEVTQRFAKLRKEIGGRILKDKNIFRDL